MPTSAPLCGVSAVAGFVVLECSRLEVGRWEGRGVGDADQLLDACVATPSPSRSRDTCRRVSGCDMMALGMEAYQDRCLGKSPDGPFGRQSSSGSHKGSAIGQR